MGAPTPQERASELLLRSHLAAAYCPERESVLVFGGSRYFTGEYFHDLLELKIHGATCDSAEASAASQRSSRDFSLETGTLREEVELADEELPTSHPVFMLPSVEGRSRLTRGLRGRFRGMARDGYLDLF